MRQHKVLEKLRFRSLKAAVVVLAIGVALSAFPTTSSAFSPDQPWTPDESPTNPPPLPPGAQGRWKLLPPPYPDVPWVKPVPTIEQLTQGKIKTGDVIKPDQLAALQPYIAEGWFLVVKDGAYLHIHATTPAGLVTTRSKIAATIANKGKMRVLPDGTVRTLDNKPATGGYPVIDPQTGVEAMANYAENYADVSQTGTTGANMWINPQGHVYRMSNVTAAELWMNDRTCNDPKPYVPNHSEERERTLSINLAPYDLAGIVVLNIIPDDQSKLPDEYLYLPILRRVQRLSAKERYDSSDGSDARISDYNSLNDPLGMWSFKMVRRGPMVWPMDPYTPFYPAMTGPPLRPLIEGKYPPLDFEVRDVIEVEATPVDLSSNIYSKKLIYLDTASYQAHGDFYDKSGKLWLTFLAIYGAGTGPCGGESSGTYYWFRNVQTGSMTVTQTGIDESWDTPAGNWGVDRFNVAAMNSQSR